WTGEEALVEKHWDAARRVLDWAREHGDRDGDGYIEYLTRSPQGPKHQGWKDSDNAVVYPDGTQVDPPIAASEVQGYWYAALQFMAVLSVVMGERGEARALWGEAKALKERFNRDFWIEEEGTVAGWLDAEKRLVRSVTSNAGHCLTTGVVADERVPALVERLFRPDLFSGWGLRTLSSENPSYNPLSYHLGSVWAVENATTLFGLRRYGFDERAQELARAIFDLARLWPGGRIPECVGGYARAELGLDGAAGPFAHPGAYPRATDTQAWNLSAFPLIVQGLLGLRPVAALDLLVVDPVLPAWIPELELTTLRVGGATVSLRFWRDAEGASHYDVTAQEGTLRVLRQPPLDALDIGLFSRLGTLVKDLLPL
ncbi:MAG: amylo-alpha-1,6-glucosidase, partial [Rhodothermales bacterium]|nr:amylo-alpha-1,6-glucosidase [Rhodothermales bacterium]